MVLISPALSHHRPLFPASQMFGLLSRTRTAAARSLAAAAAAPAVGADATFVVRRGGAVLRQEAALPFGTTAASKRMHSSASSVSSTDSLRTHMIV